MAAVYLGMAVCLWAQTFAPFRRRHGLLTSLEVTLPDVVDVYFP
jgi:hypothetical protein